MSAVSLPDAGAHALLQQAPSYRMASARTVGETKEGNICKEKYFKIRFYKNVINLKLIKCGSLIVSDII